jgi:hypothetical protein
MKQDVGKRGIPALVAVLEHDAPFDVDIAKATLETLMQLCEIPEKVRFTCSRTHVLYELTISRQKTILVYSLPTSSSKHHNLSTPF